MASRVWFFSEEPSRVLVSLPAEAHADLVTAADDAGVAARRVGRTGGEAIRLGEAEIPMERAASVYYSEP
jgi:hypothetical protein